MKYSILTILIIADLTIHHYVHPYLGPKENALITADAATQLTYARKPFKRISSQEEQNSLLFDAFKKPFPHTTAAKSEKIAEILIQQALKAGANINARDGKGNTVLDLADAQDYTHLVTFLREHGAKTYTKNGKEAEYVPKNSLLDFLVGNDAV